MPSETSEGTNKLLQSYLFWENLCMSSALLHPGRFPSLNPVCCRDAFGCPATWCRSQQRFALRCHA